MMKAPRKTTQRPILRRITDYSDDTESEDILPSTKKGDIPKIVEIKEIPPRTRTPIIFSVEDSLPDIEGEDALIEFDWMNERSNSPFNIFEDHIDIDIPIDAVF